MLVRSHERTSFLVPEKGVFGSIVSQSQIDKISQELTVHPNSMKIAGIICYIVTCDLNKEFFFVRFKVVMETVKFNFATCHRRLPWMVNAQFEDSCLSNCSSNCQ